jgi:hypothetical protein
MSDDQAGQKKTRLTRARLKEMERVPKIAEAIRLLDGVGFPMASLDQLRRVRLALALLAAAKITPDTPWSDAVVAGDKPPWAPTQKDFLKFWNLHYGTNYSMGSYDDVLRADLVYFKNAQLVVANTPPGSHSPTGGYSIVSEAADLLRTFGTDPGWPAKARKFADSHGGQLKVLMEKPRRTKLVGATFTEDFTPSYAPGEHGLLLKAIVEEFLPRHAKGAEIVLFEDNQYLHRPEARLAELGLTHLGKELLPDMIAFDSARGLLFIIESVHTTNPITKIRHLDLERITAGAKYPRIYVSVFRNREGLRKHLLDISWETEVWLVDEPDHVLHFDGDKYMVPHAQQAPAAGNQGGQADG